MDLDIECVRANTKTNVFDKQERVIAVGDLHGDIRAARACLEKAAQVANSKGDWIGGETYVVIVGDMVDRMRPGLTTLNKDGWGEGEYEGEEIDLVNYLNRLDSQARKQGGRVIKLLGNHEMMLEDGRYATPHAKEQGSKERAQALRKALKNCELLPLVQVGSWVFVHGGIVPEILDSVPANGNFYKEALKATPSKLNDDEGFLWNRDASSGEVDCEYLTEGLDRLLPHLHALGYEQVESIKMVVAHTNQYLQDVGYVFPKIVEENADRVVTKGPPVLWSKKNQIGERELPINSDCGQRVFRIDTGMSGAFDNERELLKMTPQELKARMWARRPQVLEILRDGAELRVLTARQALPRSFLRPEQTVMSLADLRGIGLSG